MSPPRRAGFTLVEVLVALVIVALGRGAVLSALSSAADNTIYLREKTFATWVGLNQLAATRLQQAFPVRGKTTGEVEFANVRWHWQQRVEDIEIPGVKRITVEVRHADAPGDRSGARATTTAERSDWLASVTGFRGDAMSPPQGTLSGWP